MTDKTDLLPLPSGNVVHLIATQAAEIEALQGKVAEWKSVAVAQSTEIKRLREALAGLITWVPSADTYRRLGFDPEAPMQVLEEACAALGWEV